MKGEKSVAKENKLIEDIGLPYSSSHSYGEQVTDRPGLRRQGHLPVWMKVWCRVARYSC